VPSSARFYSREQSSKPEVLKLAHVLSSLAVATNKRITFIVLNGNRMLNLASYLFTVRTSNPEHEPRPTPDLAVLLSGVAFSRDSVKIGTKGPIKYVQHAIRELSTEVWALLSAGAYFYISGCV
jgi:hypothetical protein